MAISALEAVFGDGAVDGEEVGAASGEEDAESVHSDASIMRVWF